MKGVFIVKEDGSTLTGIKQRSVFVLSTQFHVCATPGNEIMSGNPLLLPVEIDTVRHRMAGPSAKCMPHRRTVTACHGGDGHETDTAPSKPFLKHFAEIGRKDISFYKGVAEYSYTYQIVVFGTGRKAIESFIKRSHAPMSGITVIFNASHSGTAGIYKNRFYHRWQGYTVRIGSNRLRFRITKVAQQIHATHRMSVDGNGRKPMKPQ